MRDDRGFHSGNAFAGMACLFCAFFGGAVMAETIMWTKADSVTIFDDFAFGATAR